MNVIYRKYMIISYTVEQGIDYYKGDGCYSEHMEDAMMYTKEEGNRILREMKNGERAQVEHLFLTDLGDIPEVEKEDMNNALDDLTSM